MAYYYDKLSEAQKEEIKKGVIRVSAKAMNRTALGIVAAAIQMFPDCTLDDLKQILPDHLNPAAPRNYKSLFNPYSSRPYGVIQSGSIRQECINEGLDVSASHFTQPGESFTLKDGTEILVSRSWESRDTETGEHDLNNLIKHVSQYGIIVEEAGPGTVLGEHAFKIDVLRQDLLDSMRNPPKNNMLKWILLGAGALAAFLFWYMNRK